ncbi:MAG: hypothetical protein COA52_00675 [Hyphomicrobiales bacterium]|nr:MAG: hypothetical protein COA52_00675 [Hyphomicrobiales bacterium]
MKNYKQFYTEVAKFMSKGDKEFEKTHLNGMKTHDIPENKTDIKNTPKDKSRDADRKNELGEGINGDWTKKQKDAQKNEEDAKKKTYGDFRTFTGKKNRANITEGLILNKVQMSKLTKELQAKFKKEKYGDAKAKRTFIDFHALEYIDKYVNKHVKQPSDDDLNNVYNTIKKSIKLTESYGDMKELYYHGAMNLIDEISDLSEMIKENNTYCDWKIIHRDLENIRDNLLVKIPEPLANEHKESE